MSVADLTVSGRASSDGHWMEVCGLLSHESSSESSRNEPRFSVFGQSTLVVCYVSDELLTHSREIIHNEPVEFSNLKIDASRAVVCPRCKKLVSNVRFRSIEAGFIFSGRRGKPGLRITVNACSLLNITIGGFTLVSRQRLSVRAPATHLHPSA